MGTVFRSADLSHSRMTGAAAAEADFSDAVLAHAQLNGADLQDASFQWCRYQSADFPMRDSIPQSISATYWLRRRQCLPVRRVIRTTEHAGVGRNGRVCWAFRPAA